MEIIKNKNLLEFTLRDKPYSYNINDGCFYGSSGKPLKNCPSGLKSSLRYTDKASPAHLLGLVIGESGSPFDKYHPMQAKEFSMLYDRLLSLGYVSINIGDNFDIQQACQYSRYLGCYHAENDTTNFKMRDFLRYVYYREIQNTTYSMLKSLPKQDFDEIINDTVLFNPDYGFEEAELYAYYFYRGYLKEAFGEYTYTPTSMIRNYIAMCKQLEKPYNKTNNFLREFAETVREYNFYKEQKNKIAFAENYAKHPKAWNFAFGNFSVSIPTTGQDLIDEGKKMHHCVGNYVDSVAKNQTYICFIRRTDTPDIPYITCQVSPNGTIGQYYLAYDHRISSEADMAFQSAFQKHLQEVW